MPLQGRRRSTHLPSLGLVVGGYTTNSLTHGQTCSYLHTATHSSPLAGLLDHIDIEL